MALPTLIDAHIVPDLCSRSPSSWWLGPLSTAPIFIQHILAFRHDRIIIQAPPALALPSPEICHFSKDLGSFSWEMVFRSQRLGRTLFKTGTSLC